MCLRSGSIGSLKARLYMCLFEVSWATRPPLCPRLRPPLRPIRFRSDSNADVHGDELAAFEPKQTMPFSVALLSVALAAIGGAKPSFEATMTPRGWDPRSWPHGGSKER